MKNPPDAFYDRRENSSKETGEKREAFFMKVFLKNRASWPKWITETRQASGLEDSEGIDFVVGTSDVGDIYIQIKGSWSGMLEYIRKPRTFEICVLLIHPNMNENYVFLKAKRLIEKMRLDRLNGDRSKILFE